MRAKPLDLAEKPFEDWQYWSPTVAYAIQFGFESPAALVPNV